MQDKKIKCLDCKKEFIFSAGERKFFEEKGYNEPIRCKNCQSKIKDKRVTGFR
jgi:DNA-directed RNA polymerase subunit RPC12/RpoP